jgi:hypothetical protein
MATAYSPDPQPSALNRAILLDGGDHVFGAGGRVAARRGEQGRERSLVKFDQPNGEAGNQGKKGSVKQNGRLARRGNQLWADLVSFCVQQSWPCRPKNVTLALDYPTFQTLNFGEL